MLFSIAEAASRFSLGSIALKLRPATQQMDAILTGSNAEANAQRAPADCFFRSCRKCSHCPSVASHSRTLDLLTKTCAWTGDSGNRITAAQAFWTDFNNSLSTFVHPFYWHYCACQCGTGRKPSYHVGKQTICAQLYAVTLSVKGILNLLLIPRSGLPSAGVSTAVAMVIEATLLSTAAFRTMKIPMFIFIADKRDNSSEEIL